MRVSITGGETFRDVLHVAVDGDGSLTLRFANRKEYAEAPVGFEVDA